MIDQQLPPLANFRPLGKYVPRYSDFVIWAGWFNAWYGVVSTYDVKSDTVSIIFGCPPIDTFTMSDQDQVRNTHHIPLSRIRGERKGIWSVLQHEQEHNTTIWYV